MGMVSHRELILVFKIMPTNCILCLLQISPDSVQWIYTISPYHLLIFHISICVRVSFWVPYTFPLV